MQPADLRNRPVVLESGSADRPPRRRRRPWPRTVFGIGAAGVLAAAGVVAGSWSIMSAVGTTTPPGNNAPLWFSPPAPVATTPVGPPPIKDTPTAGSHSGPGSQSGSSAGSGSGSGEGEPERPHGDSGGPTTTTIRRAAGPSASVSVTVTPTDDHRGKGAPATEDEDGHGGSTSDGN